MDVVIIEDESIAAQNLQRLLESVDPQIRVVALLQSIEESVEWFTNNHAPQLMFLDIHLADGLSFAIFDQVSIKCPVIFTTAYDEYALRAFKLNSIDYLLKPISKDDLAHALQKFQMLAPTEHDIESINALRATMQQTMPYKSYFLVPIADRLQPVAATDIAFFYLENKVSVAYTFDGHTYTFDKPLDAMMQQLNPDVFFRANRQFIINHKAICDISFWIGSKLRLSLSVPTPDRIIISKARVADFKNWYTA